MTGKVGVPFGKTRLYAQIGATYTWSTLTTNETIGSNSQTLSQNTRGMSWTLGGGTEYWWRRSMAIYLEAGRAGLKGTVVGGGGGNLDESVIYAVAGLRFRLVGSR